MSLKPSINPANHRWNHLSLLILWLLSSVTAGGQSDTLTFWDVPDSLHKGRFWTAAGTGAVAYTGTLITLNGLWYNKYPRTSFHFFNDGTEWLQMDKAGHMFTAYFEADWSYHIARWTGMNSGASIWAGALVATGLQATIETLDGFSSEWGFSLYDFGSNLAGGSLWAAQQSIWKEQRIRMKVSSTYRQYPPDIITGVPGGETTLHERSDDLFGKNIFQSFLKDYNAQTIWLSFNIESFLNQEQNRFPKWLNVSIGYGAENMYGGFRNEWKSGDTTFIVPADRYPRHRQWYISPDVDLSRIHVKSKFLKTLLCMANIFKFPAPALEINGNGAIKWKWLYY
jgi:hypothetical protein